MNRLAPQTDAEHLAAVKRYLADHLRGAPMPDVWLESLEAVIRMAENNGRSPETVITDEELRVKFGPPAQPGSDTPRTDAAAEHGFQDVLDTSRKLERELAAAKEDRELLDWLDSPEGSMADVQRAIRAAKGGLGSYREGIRAAMNAARVVPPLLAKEFPEVVEMVRRMDRNLEIRAYNGRRSRIVGYDPKKNGLIIEEADGGWSVWKP